MLEKTGLQAFESELSISKEIKNELIKHNFRHSLSAFIKRSIDVVSGLVGFALLIPITLIVATINVVNNEKGPIFFTQERIGKDGKIFKMYKFRTMVVGAEDILQKHIDEQTDIGKEYILHKKIKNDPRITKVGKFLRATSLDEFPQFINVMKGQMSLVGPRPYLPIEKDDMKEYYDYIVQMKPGITGPWQVAGRNNLEFIDRLELDREYCERRGNRRDIKILIKTIEKVVKREGAI